MAQLQKIKKECEDMIDFKDQTYKLMLKSLDSVINKSIQHKKSIGLTNKNLVMQKIQEKFSEIANEAIYMKALCYID